MAEDKKGSAVFQSRVVPLGAAAIVFDRNEDGTLDASLVLPDGKKVDGGRLEVGEGEIHLNIALRMYNAIPTMLEWLREVGK